MPDQARSMSNPKCRNQHMFTSELGVMQVSHSAHSVRLVIRSRSVNGALPGCCGGPGCWLHRLGSSHAGVQDDRLCAISGLLLVHLHNVIQACRVDMPKMCGLQRADLVAYMLCSISGQRSYRGSGGSSRPPVSAVWGAAVFHRAVRVQSCILDPFLFMLTSCTTSEWEWACIFARQTMLLVPQGVHCTA